jgi:hypothetical protein
MANYPDLRLFIAGDWRQADGQPVVNPADKWFSVSFRTHVARISMMRWPRRNKASRSGHAPRRQSVPS